MSDWHSETHATTTVQRTDKGNIRTITCRAEYFEVNEYDEGEDEFREGVHAKWKFNVVDGDTASLSAVRDIEDDAGGGYDTDLGFIRTAPIAEVAVRNVPGIEHVQSISEHINAELDRGATALH